MSTISELMEGKQPGSIKVVQYDTAMPYFVPYYTNGKMWFGLDAKGQHTSYCTDYGYWELYQEPKPTETVYEWMYLSDRDWFIDSWLMTEHEAKSHFIGAYRKTGRQFTVEVEV